MQKLDSSLWIDLVGMPFELHGRGPTGYDCYGLLLEIFHRRGIQVQDFPYGASYLEQSRLLAENAAAFWIPSDIKAGAALLFRKNAAAQHCGVAIDTNRFIHATEDIGSVCISKLDGPIGYRRFLIGAYSHAV